MPGGAAETVAVYRSLLRAINRCITSATGDRLWVRFAQDEFRRQGAATTDPSATAAALQLARDYQFMIEAVKDHKELLLSYNVGIAVQDREKRMNARAAAYVGLAMPPRNEQERQEQQQQMQARRKRREEELGG